MMKNRILLLIVMLTVSIASVSSVISKNSYAADARYFNAGRIIDDAIFTDYNSMSVQQIQSFLNSKVSCDSYGKKRSELGGGTRAQWMLANNISAPYRCITDYAENPSTNENNYGKVTNPDGAISAAQIIYNYSQQFKINPQVIIVTLQKENGLITDEWPTPRQFNQAMGFGCPDNLTPGAPACNPSYGSFSAQVYEAARHFRGFYDNKPGWYVPFTIGNNQVMWNVSTTGCGAGMVNIENRATVALYSYTPYQPNQAAKNAQYGSGDGCSAYGNRNFYLYFSDWFGPTLLNSYFLRTVSDGTLYLVSGNTKYPIPNMDTFNSLYPLGGVGYVSQSLLDSLATGPMMGRTIKGNDGTVYFYDSGIKLPFGSCTLVEMYGSTCSNAVLLDNFQIAKLYNGPAMTNVYTTTSGKTYYIDGEKHETYDQSALDQAGITNTANILSDSGLDAVASGAPILKPNVYIRSRQDNQLYFYDGTTAKKIDTTVDTQSYFSKVVTRQLDTQSMSMVEQSSPIGGYLKSATTGLSYIVTAEGKYSLTSTADISRTFVTVPDVLLAAIPTIKTLSPPYFIKSNTSGSVYIIDRSSKREFQGWNDLVSFNSNPTILTVPDYYLNDLSSGQTVVGPGSLVKSASNPNVYLIDGLHDKIPLNSFDGANELGYKSLSIVSDASLAAYTTKSTPLGAAVICNSLKKLAVNGTLYPFDDANTSYVTLSDTNCAMIAKKDAPKFILGPDGTIYKVTGLQKQIISGYQTYLNLGGNDTNTIRANNYNLSYYVSGQRL